jgi:RNA polymerase sigma factor (sigma-70 family)
MDHDAALLREYVLRQSQDAFGALVSRHLNLVYGAAVRILGDPSLGEDVAQEVFITLARKAPGLTSHASLAGWLYRTACYEAIDLRRSRQRRQHYETVSSAMPAPSPDPPEAEWREIRPLLDETLLHLNERDRQAVILRYLVGRSYQEVGAELGMEENAARMRTDRALEKLRRLLTRKGATSSAAALAAMLSIEASVAAPPGLSAAVTAAASSLTPVAAGTVSATVLLMKKTIITGTVVLGGLFTAGVLVDSSTREAESSRHPVENVTPSRPARSNVQADWPSLSGGSVPLPLLNAAERLREHALEPGQERKPTGTGPMVQNRGRSTPLEAAESFAYACFQADVIAISEHVLLVDDARTLAEDAWERLPAEAREQWPTPEHLFALFTAADSLTHPPPTDPAILQQARLDNVAPDRVIFRWPGGDFSQEYRLTPHGWKLVLPAPLVEALINRMLGPSTPPPAEVAPPLD